MKAIDYLFTWLYRLLLKTGDKDIAEYSALIFLTVGFTIYLSILIAILNLDVNRYIHCINNA